MLSRDYFQVVTPAEAKSLLAPFAVHEEEDVPTPEGLMRVLARDVCSPEDVPPFTRSVMDGFAVSSRDTFGASSSQPVYLRITGSIEMGGVAGGGLGREEAVRIPTGGMLPPGGDAVVMIEHARILDGSTIEISRPVSPWENVMKAGDDFRKGELISPGGRRLRPQDLGALTGSGIARIPVLRRPVVGFISTGDELVPLGTDPRPGQIRSSNPYAIGAGIVESGASLKDLGHVPDALDAIKDKMKYGLQGCDFILISGGSSVGARDFTLAAMESFDSFKLLFHGIAVAPGKPTIAASYGRRLAIGLPGHPASAFIIFTVFVRPLLQGRFEPDWTSCATAVLGKSVSSAPGREDYVRVSLEGKEGALVAVPLLGKSGALKSLVRADGLIKIDMDLEGLDEGEEVKVYRF